MLRMIVGIAAFVIPLALVVTAMNILAWLGMRGGPWSWRVLLGADIYYRWLERKDRDP